MPARLLVRAGTAALNGWNAVTLTFACTSGIRVYTAHWLGIA